MRLAAKAPVTRRTALRGAAASVATLGTGSLFPKPAIAQIKTVKYTLSWLPTGQYAFIYVADQKGFWKKRGLDVQVSRGYGSMGAIQGIATGQFDMGGAATSADLLSIIKGLDLRMLATQAYDSTMGILVPENGSIKTAKDLEGKKVGVTAAGGDTPFLGAYCKAANVDFSKLTVVSLDSQIIEQSVISGQVNCMVAFGMSSIPNFVVQKFPVKLLPFKDVGLQFYWVNTLASSALVKKDPQLVQAVTEGTLDGMKYMLLNPEETIELHLKAHPEIAVSDNGKLFTELGVGMVSVSMTAEESQQHSLGYSDLKKIGKMADIVWRTTASDQKEPPAPEAYCTNEYIGKVTLTAAEWEQVKKSGDKYAKMLGGV